MTKRDPAVSDPPRPAAAPAADSLAAAKGSARLLWIVAGVLVALAVAEAIGLAVLASKRTAEANTLLVERGSGAVEALKPASTAAIAPDAELTRALLVQYVVARETFDVDVLQANYRRVSAWSSDRAKSSYAAEMDAANPDNPLARLGRDAVVQTNVSGVATYAGGLALVRFGTRLLGRGGASAPPQHWVAVIRYGFSNREATPEQRLANPFGFKVWSYRRDPEATPPPEPVTPPPQAARAAAPVPTAVQVVPATPRPVIQRAQPSNQSDEPTAGAPDQ